MPGPFPGMDPFLERPTLWPGVHQHLITYASAAINPLLPPHYVSTVGERLYVEQPHRSSYPHLMIVERPARSNRDDTRAGRTAVAERCDQPTILTIPSEQARQGFIEIRTEGDDSRIVTVIELLSHANKAPGSHGRKLYLSKQDEVLWSESHLLEIDLLRGGQHTLAPAHEQLLTLDPWDYMISLHRSHADWRYEVWPVRLQNRLPRIAIPLADNDPDIVLDLQPILDHCYDAGVFDRQVNYRREPDPPLSPEDAAWADALLKEKGLRE